MVNRKFVVVAYDIANDKRRTKIEKKLKTFGMRANYSVFECMLTNIQLNELKEWLYKTVSKKEDVVLIYPLCNNCVGTKEYIGAFESFGKLTDVVWNFNLIKRKENQLPRPLGRG